MNKIFKRFSVPFFILLILAVLLSGCSKEENTDTTQTPPGTETESVNNTETEVADNLETEIPSNTETKAITISVLNLSDVQIGMFSTIDPATGEQINLDSLEPGQSVSMECNWPNDVSLFQWALYNVDGELCMDASTDISEAEKSVILVLTGEGNIDDITALFDKEVSDLDQ